MKTIEEFPLKLQESNIIEIPYDTRILSVKSLGDSLSLYGLVLDTKDEKIYDTGDNINIDIFDYTYMGCVQMRKSMIHVFSKQIYDGIVGDL